MAYKKAGRPRVYNSGRAQFERCVVCGELTDIRFDTPIDDRVGYVVGAGQHCLRCYSRIYGTDDYWNMQEQESEE